MLCSDWATLSLRGLRCNCGGSGRTRSSDMLSGELSRAPAPVVATPAAAAAAGGGSCGGGGAGGGTRGSTSSSMSASSSEDFGAEESARESEILIESHLNSTATLAAVQLCCSLLGAWLPAAALSFAL